MKNQRPTACFLSHQIAIIPYNQSIIIPQNIDNQPPKPDNTSIDPSFRQNIFSNLLEEFQRHYTTQELLTATFVRIMCVTSFSHLVLGFRLLDKTVISNSIPPLAMSVFKYSLATLTSFSMPFAADQFSRLFKAPIRKKTRLFGMYLILPIAHFLSPVAEKYKRIVYYMTDFLYVACVGDFSIKTGIHGWLLKFGLYWIMQTIMLPITVRVDTSSEMVLVVSALATTFWAAENSLDLLTSSTHCFLDRSIQKLLPLATARVKSALKRKKTWKLVKYVIGLVGTLIFQNFFRLTTFDHVKAFMYFASSWLANLALMNASDDFGILNFLLGNMILGSTVSQFGLETTTWFTYGICLFLYILGIKLKSMNNNTSDNLDRFPRPRPPILFWIFYCCVVFDSLFNLFHQI